MMREQWRALRFGVTVHAVRFVVIAGALWIGPLLGISGWYLGLFANVMCSIYAAALITHYRLWNIIGMWQPWKGRTAALCLLIPLAEALA